VREGSPGGAESAGAAAHNCSRPPGRPVAAVRTAGFFLFVFLQMAWIALLLHHPDPVAELMTRDWSAFYRAGTSLLAGELSHIYPVTFDIFPHPRFPSGLYYLYPPFTLYLTAPLALLPPAWAYAACVLAQVAAFLFAMALLGRAVPGKPGDLLTVLLVVAGSAALNSVLILGHTSAMLLLILAAGMWGMRKDRPLAAGLLWSLLLIKPNWALFLLVWILVARRWRVLGGFLVGATLLLASGLPLGLSLWRDWFATMRSYPAAVGELSPFWRHVTLYGFWRTVLPGDPARSGAHFAWIASIIPLIAAAAVTWWKVRIDRRTLPRLIGVFSLLVLTVNPYGHFYDALLLALPGAAWWMTRESYASRQLWIVVGGAIAFIFLWQHLSLWVLKENAPALTGAAAAVWLVAELVDLWRPGREALAREPEER